MKTRIGFVSNSSSCSFVCAVTGEIESGVDVGLEDVAMVQCENEHTFYEDYLVDPSKETIDGSGEKLEDWDKNYDRWDVPARFCPICNMKHVAKEDMFKYMLKMLDHTNESMEREIKNRFSNYDALQEFLKKK